MRYLPLFLLLLAAAPERLKIAVLPVKVEKPARGKGWGDSPLPNSCCVTALTP
jgi:hypothetical protein